MAARQEPGQAQGGRRGGEGGPPRGEERAVLPGGSGAAGEAPFASRRRVEQAQHDHVAAHGSLPVARSLAGIAGPEECDRAPPGGGPRPLKAAPAPAARKDTTGPLSRENARLRKALERTRKQKDTIKALRGEVGSLNRETRRLNRETRRLNRETRRLNRETRRLNRETRRLNRENGRLNRENGRLRRELEPLQGLKKTVRRLSGEARLLRGELAGYHDQMGLIALLTRRVDYLAIALSKSAIEKEGLEAELADRPLLPAVFRRLRDRDKTIASLRKANERLGKKIRVLRARNARLEAWIAKLRTTRAVLSRALYGSKSEKQDTPGTGRKRGQQRGAPGHGRTQRPVLEEKEEPQKPPEDALVCSCCGKPYVANGERSSSVIEIEVKAHIRRIVRPRYRRGCDCTSSPLEVTAPPPARLFPRTSPTGSASGRAFCSSVLPASGPCAESRGG